MKLVVSCDGTWNRPDSKTHIHDICRAATAVLGDGSIRYVKGVGTDVGEKVRGGALGMGLSQNVRDAYRFLVEKQAAGAEIYVFGFSRGAYTARSLVGFLNFAGLLQPGDVGAIDEAYRAYRFKDDAKRAGSFNGSQAAARARKDVRVRFLGVFDTVGALGVPLNWVKRITADEPALNLEFHDVKICGNVDVACHALAIDERRGPYQPTLWEPPSPGVRPPEKVLQVWFPGVHSDIGGGYDDDDGLADLSLDWMVGQAAAAGLDLRPGFKKVGRPISPNPAGRLHDSMSRKSLWMHLLPSIDPVDRPIGTAQRRKAGLTPEVPGEYVHWSAWERVEGKAARQLPGDQRPYAPKSLVQGGQWRLPADIPVFDDRG
jgi:uncharacterized protein (DUF2235 family)